MTTSSRYLPNVRKQAVAVAKCKVEDEDGTPGSLQVAPFTGIVPTLGAYSQQEYPDAVSCSPPSPSPPSLIDGYDVFVNNISEADVQSLLSLRVADQADYDSGPTAYDPPAVNAINDNYARGRLVIKARPEYSTDRVGKSTLPISAFSELAFALGEPVQQASPPSSDAYPATDTSTYANGTGIARNKAGNMHTSQRSLNRTIPPTLSPVGAYMHTESTAENSARASVVRADDARSLDRSERAGNDSIHKRYVCVPLVRTSMYTDTFYRLQPASRYVACVRHSD